MVKRIVRFEGAEGPRLYELAYEALAGFPAGEREGIAADALDKLASIGTPKAERPANPDLVLMTLNGSCEVELLESERDILFDAIKRVPWPTFAVRKKQRLVALLDNAERVP